MLKKLILGLILTSGLFAGRASALTYFVNAVLSGETTNRDGQLVTVYGRVTGEVKLNTALIGSTPSYTGVTSLNLNLGSVALAPQNAVVGVNSNNICLNVFPCFGGAVNTSIGGASDGSAGFANFNFTNNASRNFTLTLSDLSRFDQEKQLFDLASDFTEFSGTFVCGPDICGQDRQVTLNSFVEANGFESNVYTSPAPFSGLALAPLGLAIGRLRRRYSGAWRANRIPE